LLQINTGVHTPPPRAQIVPANRRFVIQQGIDIVQNQIVGQYGCRNFAKLPRGETLQQVISRGIWVNYDADMKRSTGWMISIFPNDIVVTEYACRLGKWTVAGTIVHELAHHNGADGISHDAERALKDCGLSSPSGPYMPGITG
jgi:hypothetical protein